jgi:hypothetical protein
MSMFGISRKRLDSLPRKLRQGAFLTVLAAGSASGCSREFYREWANQDASEAVFEKSRDPRWRLDMFSIEPPALSRFAEPYDPEFLPAPPDDPATEALSPVPQWPDHRMLVPTEATTYLDMMEAWMRERDEAKAQGKRGSDIYAEPGSGGRGGTPQPNQPPGPPEGTPAPPQASPAPPPSSSPFAPGPAMPATPSSRVPGAGVAAPGGSPPPAGAPPGASVAPARQNQAVVWNPRLNSGTNPPGSSPILLAKARSGEKKTNIPPPRSASSFTSQETSRARGAKDAAVQRTSRQVGGIPLAAAATRAGQAPDRTQVKPGSEALPARPFAPPDSRTSQDTMSQETRREINRIIPGGPTAAPLTPEQAAELSSVLIPRIPKFNVAWAAGLPRNANPYVVTLQQAFTLALLNARIYQLQLETVYNAALNVTLQRFQFEPQFYAGMSPLTSPQNAGFPGVNPPNQFLYQTRSAPGGQISTLSLGEIAGFGKLFNSGGQLLMGFANQVVFNFVGKNPIQPTVSSSLPLTFVQPFLRGAGRAVVLETLTEAERQLLYAVRSFAKFRQEFIVVMLTGGTITQPGVGFNLAGFSTAGNTDFTVGFIPVAVNFANVIIDLKNVAYFEQLAALYEQLIEGESSGLSQLQVDQVKARVVQVRGNLVNDILTLRTQNDQFKQQLGLPPDTPMVPDLSLVQPYLDTFTEIDEWQRRSDRKMEDVPKIVDKIPALQDIVLDGHSILGPYLNSSTYIDNEEELEATLQSAVRIALEYRLDLMNIRAQLYDAWRNIRVKANALRGILNVKLTNQVFTPPTTTNPFAFFSQAKQFQLVLNAELPLVRVAERNAFRQAIIAYEQERRALQSQEDFIKNQLRGDIRSMQVTYITYDINKRNLVLNIRLKDQAFEQIVAPPQAVAGQGLAQTANAATQTSNLINFQNAVIGSEIALINAYQAYQLARLSVYRDIGILPYDEWEAFSEIFPAEYHGPSLGPGTGGTGPAPAGPTQPSQGAAR